MGNIIYVGFVCDATFEKADCAKIGLGVDWFSICASFLRSTSVLLSRALDGMVDKPFKPCVGSADGSFNRFEKEIVLALLVPVRRSALLCQVRSRGLSCRRTAAEAFPRASRVLHLPEVLGFLGTAW